MIYPCVVTDPKGKVTRVYTGEELILKHWGADTKCKGCGMIFKAEKKDTAKAKNFSPDKNGQYVPNLVPVRGYCNDTCRADTWHKKHKKEKKVIMAICDVCQTPFPRARKGHLRCSRKCGRVINRARNREADRIRKAKKRAKKN